MKDFFPFKLAARYVYNFRSSELDGPAVVSVTVLKIAKAGRNTAAHIRMTTEYRGDFADILYTVKKTSKAVIAGDGIVMGGRTEFPLPPAKGKSWSESGDESAIAALDDRVSIPAGTFSGCMRVETKLENSGSARRWYAPGAGLVREECSAPELEAVLELAEMRQATPRELLPPNRRRKTALPKGNGTGS
ncbi:MAG: hypothetical protein WC421_09860 [Elusimicrobiales bacterium]